MIGPWGEVYYDPGHPGADEPMPNTCPNCDGRGVWMDEPCDECVIPPGSTT